MFNKLLKLIGKSTQKTPLEDYTTELFVGVLNNHAAFRKKFCNEFLGLNSDNFFISTQNKYELDNTLDAIVDIVIHGDEEICFIENKVNSKEGYEQLNRYAIVLDGFRQSGMKTKLVYCTKNDEPKDETRHEFTQIKWHMIAHLAKEFKKDSLVKLFSNFLKLHDMEKDLTIRTTDLLALENFARIFTIVEEHLNRIKPQFQKYGGKFQDLKTINNLRDQFHHNRIVIYNSNVLEGEGWSEIIAGFSFDGKMFLGGYLDRKNPYHKLIYEKINDNVIFDEITEYETGTSFLFSKSLSVFINMENSETEIESWFKDSMKKMNQFMEETKDQVKWFMFNS